MSQSLKVAKLKRNYKEIEVVPSEIQGPEMGKKEEGTVGMNRAIKPAATEVKANNMACGFVTDDAIPSTAVPILLPRGCLWIRNITNQRSISMKRKRVIKLE